MGWFTHEALVRLKGWDGSHGPVDVREDDVEVVEGVETEAELLDVVDDVREDPGLGEVETSR